MTFCKYGWLSVVIVLAGCMPGPHYNKPTYVLPKTYATHGSGEITQTTDLSTWWRYFQDAHLDDLILQALAQNYDLRLAIEKIEETRTRFQIEAARLFPDTNAQAIVQRIRESNILQDPTLSRDSTFSYFQLGFNTLWELDIWGRLRRAKDAAYADYEAEIEAMRDVYILLLSDVATTYIDSRTIQRKIDLLNSLIQLDQQLIALLSDRYHSGIDSEIQLTREQQELAESYDLLFLNQESLETSINKLALLLGKNPEEFVLPEGKHAVPYAHEPLAIGLPSDLLRRRPDIRRAERALAAATDRVGEAVALWFPSFQLIASVAGQTNIASQLFSHNALAWTIGPSITWPFLSFGRIEFNIQEKKSIMRQALLSYAKTVLNALGDVEAALIIYFTAQDRLPVIAKKYMAAIRERDLIRERWLAGLDSQLAYVAAEKNRIRIAIEMTDIQRTLSIAIVSVYKAVGGGW